MNTIISFYNTILGLIPSTYRVPLAILILFFLIFALVNFFKRNLFWIILFIILLPAAYPAVKQLGNFIWNLIQKIPK
ncbi:MAG: hypothetical protein NTZ65_00200 [Candidatus Berkelbacteria bacterium]|nr:hypothetical protein [Candidatus Berkelbacteria bacterium]